MFLSYEPTIFEPLKRSINFAVIKPSMSGDIIKFRECSSVSSMSVFIFVKYTPYNNVIMTVQDWASLIVAILTIVSSIAFGIKWLVKHYLIELKPNSGSSLRDAVNRLEIALDEQRIDSIQSRNRQEEKLDEMYKILIDHIAKNDKK
jgi:hypothetical protein